MVKVKATDRSIATGRRVKELGRIATPGEEFYVSEARFNYLNGNNPLRTVFVIKAENEVKEQPKLEDLLVLQKEPEVVTIEPETVTVFNDIKKREEIEAVQKPKRTYRKKTTKSE